MAMLTLNDSQQRYYAQIAGNSDLPCLVFLHEGLGCHAMWKGFPEALCAQTGCPGLVYDRLGYGQSSALTEPRTVHYMHDYALNELSQLLAALIPGQPYILVGHSDGGSISLIHGAERPAQLKGMIVEAAHVFVEDVTVDGIRLADAAWEKGKLAGLNKFHGAKTEQIFKAWSDTWLTPWFKHWNIEYLLPSIECPLFVIQGVDDQYGTIEQIKAIEQQSGGETSTLFIEGCGHSPHMDKPEDIIGAMADFVQQAS